MELAELENRGGEWFWAHRSDDCLLPNQCAVHHRSDHAMRSFPQYMRFDRGLMERVCPHGVGHPDPDHLAFVEAAAGRNAALTEGVHSCDGCCREETDAPSYEGRTV